MLLVPGSAVGDPGRLLSTRSYNPFTQIFGLPTQPSLIQPEPGAWQSKLVLQAANHADAARRGDEAVMLDGETHFATLTVSRGVNERWALGADLPYVAHRPGSLDGFIEDWHDLWGNPTASGEGRAIGCSLATLTAGGM